MFTDRAKTATDNLSAVLEHATKLLNQQLWCWGRDIEFANDNLLLRHGFQRTRLPDDVSSIYRLELSPKLRVVLRGFCVFFGQDNFGGLLIRRFGFSPKFCIDADISEDTWRSDDFSKFKPPSGDQVSVSHCLLLGLVDWIRQYEAWVLGCEGVDYRRSTLVKWDAVVPAEGVVQAWRTLSLAISDSPSHLLLNANDD